MKLSIAIIALLLTFTSATQAQTEKKDTTKSENSKVAYRAEIGYSQLFRYGDYTVTSPYHTLKGGLNVEFPLSIGLGIETGLKYSFGFGDRNQQYAHNDTAKFKYSGHFIDIPIRLTYTIPIFWGMKLFAYAGPSLNLGLVHTEDIELVKHSLDPAPSNPLNYPVAGTYNSYEKNLSRFNLGLGAGGGLQWKNYRIKSGYDWGLINVSKHKNYPQKVKGWYIGFEYEF